MSDRSTDPPDGVTPELHNADRLVELTKQAGSKKANGLRHMRVETDDKENV